jgi:hypothetical protein
MQPDPLGGSEASLFIVFIFIPDVFDQFWNIAGLNRRW